MRVSIPCLTKTRLSSYLQINCSNNPGPLLPNVLYEILRLGSTLGSTQSPPYAIVLEVATKVVGSGALMIGPRLCTQHNATRLTWIPGGSHLRTTRPKPKLLALLGLLHTRSEIAAAHQQSLSGISSVFMLTRTRPSTASQLIC